MGKIISTLLFQPPDNPTPLGRSKYFWLTTSRGSQIPAFHITQPHARFTVLYSHGNAEDLGMIHNYIAELSRLLYVNILAYDYTGYGLGTKNIENIENKSLECSPSEENCYSDIEAAYDYLANVKKIAPQQIILYGRSVGSGPSCYLAQKLGLRTKNEGEEGLGGVILHSPFVSVCRVVIDLGIENKFDLFPNISRMKDITCPTFIIHGTNDGVVPFYHGRMLHDTLPGDIRYKPFWADSMGHNNIESEMCSLFIKKLQRFFLFLIKTQKRSGGVQDEEVEQGLALLEMEHKQGPPPRKRRKRPQVEIVVNNVPELDEDYESVVPKAKLNRTKSPTSVAEANAFKLQGGEKWGAFQPTSEFVEIECSIMS